MALYSGFASRQQQHLYDRSLQCILGMFVKRLLKFYTNQPSDDQSFATAISKAYHSLLRLQQHKYRQPKLSKPLRKLVDFAQTHILKPNTDFCIELQKVGTFTAHHLELKQSVVTGPTLTTGQRRVYMSRRVDNQVNGEKVPRSESMGVARPWTGTGTLKPSIQNLSNSKASDNMSEEEIDREIMKKYVKGGITFKPNLPIRKGLRGIRRKHTEPPFDNFVL